MINRNRIRYSKLALGLAIALAAAPAFAQSTSSALSGRISDAGGQPVAGADVSIVHTESGTVTHATTDGEGRYLARGLRVGGPYTITVTKDGKTETREGVYLQLNQVASLDAKLGAGATNVGTVVVLGGAISVFSPDNKGLGTSVSGRQLETAISGERSLDDIARLDPRIQVIDQNDGSISVAGQNNRYNNITVDGLSQGDPFGLNSNGLGYTGSPISPDVIAAYDLKVSDFDTGSDTVGATINAVTKSGTNDFHGSVYYAFKDAGSMVGNRDGKDYDGFSQNKTYGFTVGGPIVKDRLFFFASYEDQKVTGLKGVGTDAVSTGKISAEDVQSAIDIGSSLGLQPGGYGNLDASLEDKRYVAKLDWNISDSQRASFTYQRTEEARPTPYSSRVRDNTVVLTSNWYNIASKTDNYAFQLFSDWTENFSTEIKAGYQKYGYTAGAAVNQPEIWLNIPAHDGYSGGTIYMGEDEYRHENSIDSKKINVTVSGTYFLGDHVFKGGIDYLSNEVGDLFGRDLHGVYTFDGLDNFAIGEYSKFTKTIVPNGVTLGDIAGNWKYSQLSPFLQDTWQVNDQLSVVYGVRVNIPHADRAPPNQPAWEAAFGFPNNTTLDSSNKVVEPRFAFNYTFDSDRQVQLRGGIGLFQTVPPYVWMTNPYLNNGVTSLVSYTDRSYNPADPFSPDPYNQPGAQSSDVTSGTCNSSFSCQIDVIDPNFKLPTAWKFTLALDSELPWWGLVGSAEFQRIANKDAIAYLAPSIGSPNGTLPDGRDSYWKSLSDSETKIGSGTNSGSIPGIYYRSTLLTNTSKGSTNSLTLSLTKPMEHGFSGNFSVTWTNGSEVNPGKSSQAYSNYNYVARKNPNELVAARSGYVVPLSVKLSASWEHKFFGDYRSTATLYYNGRNGMPYSWIFGTDVNGDNISNEDLAYIPMVNDPIVNYGSATAEQIQAFQDFISNDHYLSTHRGQIAQRNKSIQPWVNQLDLGLQQELPGFFDGNKTVIRLDVYNLLNLVNNKWGQVDTLGFYGTRRLANVKGVKDGQYYYDLGSPTSPTYQSFGVYDSYRDPARVVSRWSALLTVRYEF